MKVRQILQSKNIDAIFSLQPSSTVLEALHMMAEKNIGAVLITENEKLVGIFSERDYARRVILKDLRSTDAQLHQVMTSNLITITPENTINDCMGLMSDKHIRHLPVIENEQLVGIISINDVVSYIIHDQRERIASLEGYISGSYS